MFNYNTKDRSWTIGTVLKHLLYSVISVSFQDFFRVIRYSPFSSSVETV